MREFTFTTASVTLNIAEVPHNGTSLVFLHGFTNRWQTLQPLISPFIGKYHILTYDHRGHGKSGRVPGYNAADFYADLIAFTDKFIHEPAIFIGHSMGGAIALHLAVNHPEKVRALVTGDSPLDMPTHIKVMNSRRSTKLFGLRRQMAGRPVDDLLRRGLPQDTAEELSQVDPAVMDYHASGRVGEFFTGIPSVDVARIHCPHLILQANPLKGGLVQDSEIESALAMRPDMNILKLDCGHDLDIASGENSAFFKAMKTFLETL